MFLDIKCIIKNILMKEQFVKYYRAINNIA
jgi:hypothetical protein